jgi:hypothetical protein
MSSAILFISKPIDRTVALTNAGTLIRSNRHPRRTALVSAKTDYGHCSVRVLSPVIKAFLLVADRRAEAMIEAVRPSRSLSHSASEGATLSSRMNRAA